MCILVERMRETEKNAKISCICRTHSDLKNRDYACTASFSCYLSLTVTQLLFDFINHAVAHFGPFHAPFLLVLAFCIFKDTKIC